MLLYYIKDSFLYINQGLLYLLYSLIKESLKIAYNKAGYLEVLKTLDNLQDLIFNKIRH